MRAINLVRVTVIVFLLLLSVIAVAQQENKKPLYSPPGKLVDVDGYRLHLNLHWPSPA